MAAAGVTLPVFAKLYFHEIQISPVVLWLFTGRYLISGLASQPAYYLFGHGRFGEIARHIGLEWVVAMVLSVVLAPRLGAAGIAGAFALATLVGVAVPLPWAYTEAAGLRPITHFVGVWWRAGITAVLAAGLAYLGLHWATTWPTVIGAGAVAALATLGVLVGIAWIRATRHGTVDVRTLLSLL